MNRTNNREVNRQSLGDRIYRTPVIYVVSACIGAAVAMFLLITLVFFICGGGRFTDEVGGVTYKYFGIVHDDVPPSAHSNAPTEEREESRGIE